MATVFERVKNIIVEQLGIEEDIVPSASLVDDLGADSQDLMELMIALEEEFSDPFLKIEISDEDAERLITVQDVVDYLKDLGIKDD